MTDRSDLGQALRLAQPGQFIDGYQIIELLGQGGMGAVYRVHKDKREYALKVMLKEQLDLSDLAHFQREAQATAAIRHPHVVAVHTLQLESATPYILFDYVRGQSLDRSLSNPWTLEKALSFLRPIAEALDHVHDQGLVHRDLKPANIMVREHDRCPLLADFGLARGGDLDSLTHTGMVKGTPSYMAPEQFQGLEVDGRTDQWAFAVMLYELLTGGQRPFEGDSPVELAGKVMLKDAPSILSFQEELPETIDRVFAKALAKDKEDRYESVTEFLEDCERALRGEALEGKAPPSYKGALRSFRQGGLKSVLKVLSLLVCVLLIAFASMRAWQKSEEKQRKQSVMKFLKKTLSPGIDKAQFREDFYAEFERRLIEKMTGSELEVIRPKYILSEAELLEIDTKRKELDGGRFAKEIDKRYLDQLRALKSWNAFDQLHLKEFNGDTEKLAKDWRLQLESISPSYRTALEFCFFAYKNEKEAAKLAYSRFVEVQESSADLSIAFVADCNNDHSTALRYLHKFLKSERFSGQIDAVLRRHQKGLLLSRLFTAKPSEVMSLADSIFPVQERTEKNKEWQAFLKKVEGNFADYQKDLRPKSLVRFYNNYFEARCYLFELKPWPLNEKLLEILLSAEPRETLTPRALLYSILLLEINPLAKVHKKCPHNKGGMNRQSVELSIMSEVQGKGESPIELFQWIVLFSRYGLPLELATPILIGAFRKQRYIDHALRRNPRDPFLRFWNGIGRADQKFIDKLNDVVGEVRNKPGAESKKMAKDIWGEIDFREKDLVYALSTNILSPVYQSIATAALCRLWINKIDLEMAGDPARLRKRGVELLEPLVKKHPLPDYAVGVLMQLSTTKQSPSKLSAQYEKWISLKARYIEEERKRYLESEKTGYPFAKSPFTFEENLYRKRVNVLTYTKAFHAASIGDIETGFRHLKEALQTAYHHGQFSCFFIVLKVRQKLKELQTIETILLDSRSRGIPSKEEDDFWRTTKLLEEMRELIAEIKKDSK